jgi:hypothetical protein
MAKSYAGAMIGVWLVSAGARANRRVVGQSQVADPSNEITAVPELLKQLDITGGAVTVDARHTHTALAQQIVDQQADYIMPVKENQPTLYEDVQMLFDGFDAYHVETLHYPPAIPHHRP